MSPPHTAWLGLGANLGDPVAQFGRALTRLASHERIDGLAVSRVWHGPYRGPEGPQPDYSNLCVRVRTSLSPHELLDLALDLERRAGRRRSTPEAPRTLDIDLLLFDTLRLDEPGLTLPHPRMRERRFVLEPLAELDPDLQVPPDGASVRSLLARPEVATQPLEAGESLPAGALGDGSGS